MIASLRTLTIAVLVAGTVVTGRSAADSVTRPEGPQDRLAKRMRDVEQQLAAAQEELIQLVKTSTPIVRPPGDLVESLVEMEHELFDTKVELMSLDLQIEQLTKEIEARKKSASEMFPEGASREQIIELKQFGLQVRQAANKVEAAEKRMEMAQKQFEKGIITEDKRLPYETELVQSRIELERAELLLNFAEAEADIDDPADELVEELKELVAVKDAETVVFKEREKRMVALHGIYDRCFEYERLTESIIPRLKTEIEELQATMRAVERDSLGLDLDDFGDREHDVEEDDVEENDEDGDDELEDRELDDDE